MNHKLILVSLYPKAALQASAFLTPAEKSAMMSWEMMIMTMEEMIPRINELARKAKTVGLTEDEAKERDALRQEYLAAFRKSLNAQLDNTYIVTPDGTKHKLKKK